MPPAGRFDLAVDVAGDIMAHLCLEVFATERHGELHVSAPVRLDHALVDESVAVDAAVLEGDLHSVCDLACLRPFSVSCHGIEILPFTVGDGLDHRFVDLPIHAALGGIESSMYVSFADITAGGSSPRFIGSQLHEIWIVACAGYGQVECIWGDGAPGIAQGEFDGGARFLRGQITQRHALSASEVGRYVVVDESVDRLGQAGRDERYGCSLRECVGDGIGDGLDRPPESGALRRG